MVKRFLWIAFSALVVACGNSSQNLPAEIKNLDSLRLIPYPQQVERGNNLFKYTPDIPFSFSNELRSDGWDLISLMTDTCSNEIKVIQEPGPFEKSIQLIVDSNFVSLSNSSEAYDLVINEKGIILTARAPEGIARGVQTIKQLMSEPVPETGNKFSLYFPSLHIHDYPQFEHRGLLLDVCRHFFDKQVVLKYIDALAFYKMNVLHFHLTEDQGWRMPIDKYPLLNEVSAWRTDTSGEQYGGFYSKKDLKEIVAYAEEKHVAIIPEIELPGHAQAALAAYPQFSCNGGPIEVVNDWGVFKEIYCAGNDSTFIFLEDVLTEVMEIFPSKYIHIGGDEAPKFRWEHCEKCQKRMKNEGLKDEHELQSYFIQRIERFLNKNGRQLIGWDEILEGGLSENASVQSWRGMEGGKHAAEQQHNVVMSPTSHCYLDYSLSSIDLQKIYSFDPIPEDLDPQFEQYIIGGECNMWTEHVPDEANLDSKVFPRMIGLAEVLWTYPEKRDFEDFYNRLQHHYPWLSAMYIQYGLETIGTHISEEFTDTGIQIVLEKNLPDLELKYRWEDMQKYTNYTTSIPLENTGFLYVQAYKNGQKYGDSVAQYFMQHPALNKEVSYATQYNEWYIGNEEKHLVDGKIGSIDFRDGNWQGFWGKDIDVTIDLGKQKTIQMVSASFYQYANSWIFLPKKVTVEISQDGSQWHMLSVYENNKIDLTNQKRIEPVNCIASSRAIEMNKAQYIRLKAENIGKVPDGHEAAGQDAWLFIDEIVIW